VIEKVPVENEIILNSALGISLKLINLFLIRKVYDAANSFTSVLLNLSKIEQRFWRY
jgi:hypothetical protein